MLLDDCQTLLMRLSDHTILSSTNYTGTGTYTIRVADKTEHYFAHSEILQNEYIYKNCRVLLWYNLFTLEFKDR
jgi:hypothetical protein